MDIKDVSIKDLFTDIKTSFRKLEQHNQKLNKEERRHKLLNKKRHNQQARGEEGVLFPTSMVNPNWNNEDTAVAADEMPSSSELPSKQSDSKSSEQPPTVASSSLPPSSNSTTTTTTTTKPKKTMAESILELLAAHNNSTSTQITTSTSNTTTTHSLPTKNNISEAELKRRRDIEQSIRTKSKQIIQENERLSKLKPLNFSKPTFKLPQDKISIKQGGQDGREGSGSSSSLSSLGKKRKASSITSTSSTTPLLRCYTGTSTNPTSIPNNNCFQLQQLGSNRNHSGIYAASSSALPPPSKPYTNPYEAVAHNSSSGSNVGSGLDGSGGIMGGYLLPYGSNRQYTQEEVRGLVDFAQEWITPDSMKRRRI